MAKTFNLGDLFEIVAEKIPDRTALIAGNERPTFRELNERVDQVAAALRRRGIGRGMRVGLMMYTSAAYFTSFLAACKIGALPFNLNYRYEADELLYLLKDAEPAALIVHSQLEPVVRQVKDEIAGLDQFIVVYDTGETPSGDATPFAILQAEPVGSTDIVSGRSDDDSLLIYTGGTTGLPKGVNWTHRDLFYGALGGGGSMHPDGPINTPDQLGQRAAQGTPIVSMSLLPLMHGAGLWGALTMLLAGNRVVLFTEPSFDGAHIWDIVEREKVVFISLVGDAMATPLIDAWDAYPGRWSVESLRMFAWGGAALSGTLQQGLRQRFPNVGHMSGLGSSESGMLGAGAPTATGEGMMSLPPRPDLAVVVDAKRFAKPGETGILARSGFLPQGYWRDPEKTAATFPTIDGRRWVLTGDRVRLELDGTMTLFGRDSTSINSGGEKVYAEEVESVVRAHPAVRDVVVVGIPDQRWGKAVVAVAALRPGTSLSLEELRAHCEGRLARYKIPKTLVLAPEIKRSPAGKADYQWANKIGAGDE
jgi:fatty-acyl-CoA synthase